MKKKNGFIILVVLGLAMVLAVACGKSGTKGGESAGVAEAKQEQAADQSKIRFIPDPLIFVKFTEQRESAFSCLVPKGWTTEGGIFYLDPNQAGGYANAVGPKINFAMKKDAAGTVMIQWLPDYYYIDGRFSPAGQMGLFPPARITTECGSCPFNRPGIFS